MCADYYAEDYTIFFSNISFFYKFYEFHGMKQLTYFLVYYFIHSNKIQIIANTATRNNDIYYLKSPIVVSIQIISESIR